MKSLSPEAKDWLKGPKRDWSPLMEILRQHPYLSSFRALCVADAVFRANGHVDWPQLQDELRRENTRVKDAVDPDPVVPFQDEDRTPVTEEQMAEMRRKVKSLVGTMGDDPPRPNKLPPVKSMTERQKDERERLIRSILQRERLARQQDAPDDPR